MSNDSLQSSQGTLIKGLSGHPSEKLTGTVIVFVTLLTSISELFT